MHQVFGSFRRLSPETQQSRRRGYRFWMVWMGGCFEAEFIPMFCVRDVSCLCGIFLFLVCDFFLCRILWAQPCLTFISRMIFPLFNALWRIARRLVQNNIWVQIQVVSSSIPFHSIHSLLHYITPYPTTLHHIYLMDTSTHDRTYEVEQLSKTEVCLGNSSHDGPTSPTPRPKRIIFTHTFFVVFCACNEPPLWDSYLNDRSPVAALLFAFIKTKNKFKYFSLNS